MNTEQSSKVCASVGNCTFNVGFKRGFAGEASADYTLTKGANGIFEAFTYAAQYSSGSGDPDRSTSLFIVSDPKNISLEKKSIRPI